MSAEIAYVRGRGSAAARKERASGWSSAAIAALLFLSVGLYPFSEARIRIGALELPYATIVLGFLGLCLVSRALVESGGVEVPFRVVVATWSLGGAAILSALVAYLSRRAVDATAFTEIVVFAAIPLLLVAVLRQPRDINLSFAAFYAGLLYLVGFGFYRYVTEHREWLEFHYEEATRNGDAFYLTAAFSATAGLLSYFARERGHTLLTLLLAVTAAACGVAVVLSLSRSAWIASAVGGIVGLRLRGNFHRPRRGGLAAGGILIVLLTVSLWAAHPYLPLSDHATETVRARAHSLVDSNAPGTSNLERAHLVKGTLSALPASGWLGVGIGNFRDALETPSIRLQHAHNMFLNLWVEVGFLALVGFCLLLMEFRHALASSTRTEVEMTRRGIAAVGAAWIVNGIFETPTTSLFFWAVLGLGLAVGQVGLLDSKGGESDS